ncbi:Toll/interleukin-1 receptor domain-containing protein, partial [Tanacetum coccineum]
MEMRINKVLSSLELGTEDVRMIGIKGIGGGGKTTLATTIFNQICHQFEGKSLVDNVREVSKNTLSGLTELQEKILKDIFSDQNITVSSVSDGKNKMVQMLRRKKILVVLDDVDSTEQLEALAGDPGWFKLGSRVIITTRDKQILLAHGVKFIDVNLLSRAEAICLLSKNAFKRDIPIEGYEVLSERVVKYADGLPLAIKVLELSYKSLDDEYKQIFLDVACLLKGWKKDHAIRALESCGFHAKNGLRVLEQRSLINIPEDGKLTPQFHESAGGLLRLKLPLHSCSMTGTIYATLLFYFCAEMGTHATQCITVDHRKLSFEMLMKGIANMKELRFLQLYGANYLSINFFTRIVYKNNWNLPNALRFLKWKGYPFSSLPKTFQANNLVALEMKCNRMVQLWKDGVKKVERWKVLFPVTPNLKDLHINYCNELERLHMPAECPKLVNLHLSNLDKLRTLHLGITPNLEKLQLKGTDLVELHMPAECPKLVYLGLYYNENLTTLHLGISPNLKTVSLEHCHALIKLQIPAECPKLVNLTLYDCTKVAELPEGIGRLECLKELDITGTHISRLPQSGAPVVLFVIASGRIDVLLLRRIERFLLIHGSDRPRILIKLE